MTHSEYYIFCYGSITTVGNDVVKYSKKVNLFYLQDLFQLLTIPLCHTLPCGSEVKYDIWTDSGMEKNNSFRV